MKIKKVLLITPPAITLRKYDINPLPPLGLAYIGAVLEREGIKVKVVDSLIEGWHSRRFIDGKIVIVGLDFKEIENIINSYQPDIVGISALFTKQRNNAHQIAAIVKKIDKSIITTMGGAHPTACPEMVMEDRNVDFVVIGEGEQTIIELVDFVEGRKTAADLDGVALRSNGNVKVIPKTKFIENLDELPFPARHLLGMEKYFGLSQSHGSRKRKRFSPIITSRGCPAQCTFCSAHKVWGHKFRVRSPENIIQEMKYIKETYGIEEILFEDDNTTLDVRRASRIFDLMIEEKLQFVWDTPNGVAAFALDKPLIKKMADSGCYCFNLAIESGNQEHLRQIIKKPLNLGRVPPLVEYARDLGLDVNIFLVMGMPGETEEMMWDSFKMSARLGIYHPFISIATPYPGTELYETSRAKGYLRSDFTFDDLYIRGFSVNTPEWDTDKLKRIYKEGRRWLLLQSLKRDPLKVISIATKKVWENPWLLPEYVKEQLDILTVGFVTQVGNRVKGLIPIKSNFYCGTVKLKECLKDIWECLKTGTVLKGPWIEEYERRFAERIGVKHAVSFATGRMSLYAILEARGIGEGDEVILQAFTCVVVANAIIYRGARPVYVDIEEKTFNMDVAQLEDKITPRTKAIIVQHTFGKPCKMSEIKKIAERRNLPIIEDCAHALDASIQGHKVGSFGIAGFFSTDHTKVISTSTGGIAVTNDGSLAKKLRELQEECPSPGIRNSLQIMFTILIMPLLTHPFAYRIGKYMIGPLKYMRLLFFFLDELDIPKSRYSYPIKFANVQARLGLSQLEKQDRMASLRIDIAKRYDSVLKIWREDFDNNGYKHIFLRYSFLVKDRKVTTKRLGKCLELGDWFTSVTQGRRKDFEKVLYSKGSCPVAEYTAEHIVNLPTHPRVRNIDKIINMLKDLKEGGQILEVVPEVPKERIPLDGQYTVS